MRGTERSRRGAGKAKYHENTWSVGRDSAAGRIAWSTQHVAGHRLSIKSAVVTCLSAIRCSGADRCSLPMQAGRGGRVGDGRSVDEGWDGKIKAVVGIPAVSRFSLLGIALSKSGYYWLLAGKLDRCSCRRSQSNGAQLGCRHSARGKEP